jgi:hypothetical protein
MKPFYLLLVVIAACCAYVFALNEQANHIFPKTSVPVQSTGAVQVDDVINATNVQHLKFSSTHQCLTQESLLCWDTEPKVVIQ